MQIRPATQFCWNCQADQNKVGPPESTQSVRSQANAFPSSASTSFGRPVKVKLFDEFIKDKAARRQKPTAAKKAKVEDPNVTIFIGRKHFVDDRLKTIWGKRLPITIPSKANYATVLEKALEKWKAFDCHFNYDVQHVIVYDDGRCAQFMPGTNKDFFSLECYKREVGKEYKRITLYLCKMKDYNASLGIFEETDNCNEDLDLQWDINDYFKEPDEFVEQAVCLEQSPKTSELLPVELFSEKEECSPKQEKENHFLPKSSERRCEIRAKRVEDILQSLHSKVDMSQQFYLVIRRSAPLHRVLRLWQRQGLLTSPLYKLTVKFTG